MKYDDVEWHYGGDFPEDSPEEYAATHIALFLKWCILNGLSSDYHTIHFAQDIEDLQNGKMTATQYLFKNIDGKFTSEDLNDKGNEFAQVYYGDDGLYYEDYSKHFVDLLYEAPEEDHDFEKFSSILEARMRSGILTEPQRQKTRTIYLLYTFIIGTLIISLLIFAGIKEYHLWPSVLLGGLVNTIFRVSKRTIKKNYSVDINNNEKSNLDTDSISTAGVFSFMFLSMVIVSAFWYGVGVLGKWLLS